MNPSTNSADIEAAAASWFARRESGAWASADDLALEAWLNEATAHRIAYLRLATAWERSGRMQALGAGIASGTIPPRDAWGFQSTGVVTKPTQAAKNAGKFRRFAVAAAALVTATVALAVWLLSMNREPVYSTQVGTLATVPLSDGSTILLNTDSRIHVDLKAAGRVVTLDRGEAYFDVAKDPSRPFVVKIGSKRVTAMGAQFAMRRDQGDLRVWVTEGRVRLGATQVDAGFVAHTFGDTVLVDQPSARQVEDSLSWRSGYLVFHETPLADAIAEFNRYNARKIIIADPTIAALRIGGRFRFTDSGAFLWLLQNGFPINVAQDSTTVRLTRR